METRRGEVLGGHDCRGTVGTAKKASLAGVKARQKQAAARKARAATH